MNKAPKITFLSLTFYCLLCVSYICVVFARFFSEYDKNTDTGLIIYIVIGTLPAILGIILTWFSSKGFGWARYALGTYSLMTLIIFLFLPIAQHKIDRTPIFYTIWIVSIISMGLLVYSLLVNKNSINYLRSRR